MQHFNNHPLSSDGAGVPPPRPLRQIKTLRLIASLIFLSEFLLAAGTPPTPGFHLVTEDDCGKDGHQPHLASGASWTITDAERTGMTIDDPRLLTFNHGDEIVYHFVGLRPDAHYQLRVFYFNVGHPRAQRLVADGVELHGSLELPLGKLVTRTLDLPKEIYPDAEVNVAFRKTIGFGALISAIELWSDSPDLLVSPGPMMRFHIQKLPPGGGVAFSAAMKIHHEPWNAGPVSFNPDGRIGKPLPHEQTGFTPWYDLRKVPGFGGECSMILNITDGSEGTIQFSRFPDAGLLRREINWNEPDGKRISFEGFDSILTFRDQERRTYLMTLATTDERLFPLTRPPLLFANAWGYTTGGAAEYMVKTFRLLGLNCVATSENAEKYGKLYGWGSAGGRYWPPLYFPGFWGIKDEPTAAAMYDAHFRKVFSEGEWKNCHEGLRSFQICDEPKEQEFNSAATANNAFREWAAGQGLEPGLFAAKDWSAVQLSWKAGETLEGRRLYYWSRKFKAYATPKMFAMAAAACRAHAPGQDVKAFVALSGHHLYMGGQMPLDMFQLAQYPDLTPGISDWMTTGNWWWDSHQSVAFSVAPFNAGARRYGKDFGKPPVVFPMMHCVYPSLFRAFTQLANQCKLISYYNYGPSYEVTEGYWSGNSWSHQVVQQVDNEAAQVDDILGPGVMRPSRVALLYSMSTEIWWPTSSFADKRAAFLALSHDYFQPELVTEDQIAAGALEHYDALYVLDSFVARQAQDRIAQWVKKGGLLWACSEALVRDEYNEPYDVLNTAGGLKRTFGAVANGPALKVAPTEGQANFAVHSVPPNGRPSAVVWEGARVRACYGDGVPAWLEKSIGHGKIVYLGHRCGLSYSQRAGKRGEFAIWPEIGRSFLTQPLMEAGVKRELSLSVPCVMAMPLSTEAGTVVVLYNMNTDEPTNVTATLREPAPPASVQWFDKQKNLVALPFEYENGLLHMHLARLSWDGNMLLVRRTAPPADDRLARMRETTEAHLASDDWQTLSAGAWFAGFFPNWGLGPKLIPLLQHTNWAVRRSAAESLGRLAFQGAGDALHAAAEIETDSHALSDELFALAKLGRADVEPLCQRQIDSGDPFKRAEANRALQTVRKKLTPTKPQP